MAEPTPQGVMVRELLTLDELRDLRILAGDRGLNRRVNRVTVVEVADQAAGLQPGELVLTSGFGFRNRSGLAQLLRSVFQRNVAAVGFQRYRHTPRLPRTLLEEAGRLGLPVLEIPGELVWSTVIEAVTRCIFERTRQPEGRLGRNLEQLLQLAANRASVVDLLKTCARLTRCALLVVDRRQPTLVGPFGGEIREDSLRRLLAGLPATSSERITDYVLAGGRAVEYHAFPIFTRAQMAGYLVAVVLEGPVYPDDQSTLAKAAELVGYAFHLARWPDPRFRDQFLQAWLSGMLASYGSVVEQARSVGLELAPNYFLVLICPQGEGDPASGRRVTEEIRDFVARYYLSGEKHGIVGATTRGAVYLGPMEDREPPDIAQARAEQDAEAIDRSLRRRFPDLHVRLAVGRIARSLEDLPESYRSALEALEIALAFQLPPGGVMRPQASLYQLLYYLDNTRAATEFVHETLGPLLDHDRAGGLHLVPTLAAYLSSRNVAMTAQRLFTHYNTVRYRLGQIQKILGKDLDRLDDCLAVFLALQLYRLAEKRSGTPV